MQSQQKKVKWSRGETADALQERTDTGITQVSVSRMENIIADIYGNISRRPSLKVISSVTGAKNIPAVFAGNTTPETDRTDFSQPPQYFVFTIDADTYIIFMVNWQHTRFGGLLIRNNKFVKRVTITNTTGWTLSAVNKQISVAQYNNFMVVSNLYIGDVILRLTGDNDITVEKFQFTAPWYAPNGTKSITVSSENIAGLKFNDDGQGFTGFSWTDESGISSPYSLIDTGLNGDTTAIANAIPVGSIVKFANLGAYMRVEGYTLGGHTIYFSDTTFDSVGYSTHNTPIPPTPPANQKYAFAKWNSLYNLELRKYINGELVETLTLFAPQAIPIWVKNAASGTGYSQITQLDGGWTDVPSSSLDVQMFGPLLTPVANSQGKDASVTVETGYISLDTYQPTKFTFSNQRLYAAGFYNAEGDPKQIPGYAVGSQIGRYNDFKNDYNTQTEAVVIDISTSYQEQIMALVDYNGLKILTDSAEYSYSAQNGIIKQSENGSLEACKPLIFGSVCLYADKSGSQIRAMQYELQTDLFTSSSINQVAKEDLIFNTTSMAGFLDKEHYTGRFLYATQFGYKRPSVTPEDPIANHSMAVCNFVPGNQAMIWSRWNTPDMKTYEGYDRHTVLGALEVNNKVWFIIGCYVGFGPYIESAYTLAELDYEHVMDFETTAQATDTAYKIIPATPNFDMYAWVDQNDPTNIVYTKTDSPIQNDPIYNKDGIQISTATNSPGGPNITIDGVGYYEWNFSPAPYTKSPTPEPTGSQIPPFDESRRLYDANGIASTQYYIVGYNSFENKINVAQYTEFPIIPVFPYDRVPASTSLQYTYQGTTYTANYTSDKNIYAEWATLRNTTVSVFDGDEYKWDDTVDTNGTLTKSLANLTDIRIGFKVNAVLESHPIDVGGKTYTDHKRIGKCVAVIRDTEPGAFTICDKTGYTSNDKKVVNFYGCTGMKDEVRYTIKNIQGAKFTIESLTMIIEYATLDS